jgi:hypothetical protein
MKMFILTLYSSAAIRMGFFLHEVTDTTTLLLRHVFSVQARRSAGTAAGAKVVVLIKSLSFFVF